MQGSAGGTEVFHRSLALRHVVPSHQIRPASVRIDIRARELFVHCQKVGKLACIAYSVRRPLELEWLPAENSSTPGETRSSNALKMM